MIILKCTKNVQFQKAQNLLLDENINKSPSHALNNNLIFKLFKLNHSNFKNNIVKCIILNVQFSMMYVCKDEYTYTRVASP